MTHFGEFSNSGLNLSIFHFFKQNLDPVFIFTTLFVKNYACASILYFQVTPKIYFQRVTVVGRGFPLWQRLTGGWGGDFHPQFRTHLQTIFKNDIFYVN